MTFVKDTFNSITGKSAADAASEASSLQADATELARQDLLAGKEQGLGFLQPYESFGAEGLAQSSFLTDPQAQFDYLQSNPLFQMGLDNANESTLKLAAAQGRLSAGDTLEQLNNNALLTASPLITNQQNAIQNQINSGLNLAQTQANTSIGVGTQLSDNSNQLGNVLSSGVIGEQAATDAGTQNLINLAALAASDPALKTNIVKVDEENGFNIYTWDWNDIASDFGLNGSSRGVMADEVLLKMPSAVGELNGYMAVDYSKIGVSH